MMEKIPESMEMFDPLYWADKYYDLAVIAVVILAVIAIVMIAMYFKK